MSRLFGELRQVGIVVRDIEAAMKHWVEVCGVGPWFYTDKLAVTEFSYRGTRYAESEKAVHITVADNGKGIPREHLKHIFNPGFTTKKRGWGLGLSLCRRIVNEYHDGKIYVGKSQKDVGTQFEIVLP